MNEYKIYSADIAIRCDATIDDLIDVLEAKSRSYIPVVYALNKIDAISIEELDLLYRIPNAVPISSEHGWNIDELLAMMWEKLSLKRIYTKPKGKAPDYTAPVVLRATGCTVEDFVRKPQCPLYDESTMLTFRSVTPFTALSKISSNTPLCMADLSSTSRSELVSPTSLLMRTLVPNTDPDAHNNLRSQTDHIYSVDCEAVNIHTDLLARNRLRSERADSNCAGNVASGLGFGCYYPWDADRHGASGPQIPAKRHGRQAQLDGTSCCRTDNKAHRMGWRDLAGLVEGKGD
jgi:hypothetical protein